ncbi:hypothetical protein DRN94_002535 [archaeon]|nr:hypothetical protein [archaeon]
MEIRILGGLVRSPLPSGFNLVLSGPPGAGTDTFLYTLVADQLAEKGRTFIIVTTTASAEEVAQTLMNLGADVQRLSRFGTLRIIDAYSWLIKPERGRISLANLADLSHQMFSAAATSTGEVVVVFHSLSTLYMYHPEENLLRFVHQVFARVKAQNYVGIFTVEEGIHSPPFYGILYHLADGLVRFQLKERENLLTRTVRIVFLRHVLHEGLEVSFDIEPTGRFRVGPEAGQYVAVSKPPEVRLEAPLPSAIVEPLLPSSFYNIAISHLSRALSPIVAQEVLKHVGEEVGRLEARDLQDLPPAEALYRVVSSYNWGDVEVREEGAAWIVRWRLPPFALEVPTHRHLFLAAFLSGFFSELLGRKIRFEEISCSDELCVLKGT